MTSSNSVPTAAPATTAPATTALATTRLTTTRLGPHGPAVGRLGFGGMALSGAYGPADRDESIRTVHAALDAGVTLVDTGDFYGFGHNELLLADALRGRDRDSYQLSVKFGGLREPGGGFTGFDARPAAVANFLGYSLVRLGVDHLDIYRPGRLDPAVPIEDTVGALAEQVQAGRIRYVGLSEVGADTLRRAAAVHPISDLQIEYSLLSRGIEDGLLQTCRELGVGVTAYGVLSRGLIGHAPDRGAGDTTHAHWPRFQGDNLATNLDLVGRLEPVAARHGITVAQLAIAWVAAQGDDVVPLLGTRHAARVADAVAAVGVALTADDLAEIDRLVPANAVAGSRYPDALMATLDSENAG